jgi:hypothetical protein
MWGKATINLQINLVDPARHGSFALKMPIELAILSKNNATFKK